MKGLESIPTSNDLLKAYNTLQFKQKVLLPSKLAFWSQWSRFDPRLAEIMVFYISKNWRGISALTLNREIKKQPWPGVLGVLLEQVILFAGFSINEKILFRNWARFVMTGVSRASFELFFIGLRSLGGRLALQDAVLSHKTYKKWGYLGREVLINKGLEKASTLVPHSARMVILKNYLKTHDQITLKEYRNLLSGYVSVRQSQYDLKKHEKLKSIGNTRARYFIKFLI